MENVIFFCHFYPTKGRGMSGMSTSVSEVTSRTGWVPVGLLGCGMGIQDSSHINTFLPFLMCFIHKLPTANS